MNYIVGRIYKYLLNGDTRYFVYIGDSDDASKIIGGEVGAIDDTRSYLALTNLHVVLFTDTPIFVRSKTVVSCLYTGGKPVDVDKQIFVTFINKIIEGSINRYRDAVINNYSVNYDPSSNNIFDLTLAEKIIRLLNWNDKKRELKFDTHVPQMPNCIKYGIYFAYLGTNVGSEINKLRPVVIWRQHRSANNPLDSSYFVFPVSSKIPSKGYFYNVHITVNGDDNVIHINDGRRISGLRVLKPLIDRTTGKMVVLDEKTKNDVKEAIKKYFNL